MSKKLFVPKLIALLVVAFGIFYFGSDKPKVDRNIASGDLAKLQNNLRSHVEFLTTLSPSRTSTNIPSLERAADYIFSYLRAIGMQPRYQSYQVKDGNQTKTYRNITALYGDPSKPRIVIGAHYDVCDEEGIAATKIIAGADDNASGVAGLLELARLIQEKHPNFEDRSIEFVAYTLEEPPYFRTTDMGSYFHASELNKNKIDVRLMVSLEMIGYYSDEPNSQKYPINFGMKNIYGDKGNFIAVIGNTNSYFILNDVQNLFSASSPLTMNKLSAPGSVRGIDWSDHMNYWKFNYPAIMVTDTSYLRNHNYHEVTDTIDTLNFEKMSQVVIGMQNVVWNYK